VFEGRTGGLGPLRWYQRVSWQRRITSVVLYIVLTALAFTFLFPFLWSASASVKTLDKVYEYPPKIWPEEFHWENFPEALGKLPFGRFILNTLVICFSCMIGQVLTASLVGYSFARLRWKGRDLCFILLLGTMMLPGQVLMIPHYLMNHWLGWVGTYKPLIVPSWLGGGAFFIFLFRQFFRSIPREREEAARVDGATDWKIYWTIMMPLAKPVVATVAVLSFIAHWQEFMGPLIYLSDIEKFPISLGIRMYQSLEGSWANLMMAASIVAVLPLIVIFFFAQRYFVRSLLLTGTKG